jgi:hypothetical protein
MRFWLHPNYAQIVRGGIMVVKPADRAGTTASRVRRKAFGSRLRTPMLNHRRDGGA